MTKAASISQKSEDSVLRLRQIHDEETKQLKTELNMLNSQYHTLQSQKNEETAILKLKISDLERQIKSLGSIEAEMGKLNAKFRAKIEEND